MIVEITKGKDSEKRERGRLRSEVAENLVWELNQYWEYQQLKEKEVVPVSSCARSFVTYDDDDFAILKDFILSYKNILINNSVDLLKIETYRNCDMFFNALQKIISNNRLIQFYILNYF